MSFEKPLQKSLKTRFILAVAVLPFMAACTSKKVPPPMLAPVANSVPVATVWNKHVGASTKLDLTKYVPAVDGNQLFTSDTHGNIDAIQVATGKTSWHIRLKQGVSGGVAVGAGAVYVPTKDGHIYALNEQNGQTLWHKTLPNQSNTAPTYASSQVYVKTIDDKLVALSASTGQIAWSYDEGSTELQLLGSSRAAVSGDMVAAGFSDGKVDGVNAANGQLIWQTTVATPQGFSDVDQMIGVFADPIISGNTVYVASYNGSVAALDLNSGAVKWQTPFSSYANIGLSNDAIFAVNPDGKIVAFNRTNGAIKWKQDALAGRQLSGIAMDGNNLVLGDNLGNVHWLSQQDGHFVARTSLGKSAIAMPPVVASGHVIVLEQDGNMVVLRLVQ
ncbi:MAG: outer membrane protein assembly factor BamB [Gammaproteobacteria bacterium]|nr:outer membrane protein assembly factor BamB [Gammaproteobacteria bacterium]